MPKQKTHKGTAKRVRVTGTGKLVREHTNNQHKFEVKSSSRKRRVSGVGVLSPVAAGGLECRPALLLGVDRPLHACHVSAPVF